METLGIRLKQLRKDKKLTQQQLADKVGVSKHLLFIGKRMKMSKT
jgi:transcriptional regulator with XRE-family HTH domain